MKILYSCLSRSWGGMEMNTLTSVRQLLNRNISTELICLAESRIHIEAVNMGLITHPVEAAGYFHPVTSIRLSNIIKKGNFDLIHTQESRDLWMLVPALKLRGIKIPLILTKQVGSFINKKDFLHAWLYNRVTYALAISNVIRNNLIQTCPLEEEKVLLLHNGVDINRFNPDKIDQTLVRKELNISDNEVLIGMLARFSRGKGHEEFLYAANELNKEYNHLKFVIVGEASHGESDYADTIHKLAKDYELKNLIFTGFRSDTENVLAALDIFVMPSHAEAFGIALAEAMAMGLPSVCSNSDGLLDIAVDGVTSFLFIVRNGDDLKKKISPLIESNELRLQFGKAARKRAIENFELGILTDRVIEIYKQTLEQKQI